MADRSSSIHLVPPYIISPWPSAETPLILGVQTAPNAGLRHNSLQDNNISVLNTGDWVRIIKAELGPAEAAAGGVYYWLYIILGPITAFITAEQSEEESGHCWENAFSNISESHLAAGAATSHSPGHGRVFA